MRIADNINYWQPQITRLRDATTELRTRPDRDDLLSVQVYKTAERTKVEAEGYTIIANVGDQIGDLEGEPGPTLVRRLRTGADINQPAISAKTVENDP